MMEYQAWFRGMLLSTLSRFAGQEVKFFFQKLQVDKKIAETDEITSFYLKRKEEKSLPKFEAGQYLSFKIKIGDQIHLRNYSISCGENAQEFRISVKKENAPPEHPGIISNHLHKEVQVGNMLEVSLFFTSAFCYFSTFYSQKVSWK